MAQAQGSQVSHSRLGLGPSRGTGVQTSSMHTCKQPPEEEWTSEQ